MYRYLLIILSTLLLAAMPVEGRKRTSGTVKKEKQENARRMQHTRGQIKTNIEDTRRQLAQFQSIEAEIAKSDTTIRRLQARTDSAAAHAKALADSVASTEARVADLKKRYSSVLRAIRTQRQAASATAFIVASSSFTEARKRIRYLDELNRSQKEKAANLAEAAILLKEQHSRLDSVRRALADDLAALKTHKQKLEKDRNTADAIIAKLKRDGRKLEQVLVQQQENARKLDRELERIIEQEAREAAEAERRRKAAEEEARKKALAAGQDKDNDKGAKAKNDGKDSKKKTAPQKDTKPRAKVEVPASDFASAKGKLPMPVDGPAMIVADFGRHRHKDFERVEMMNNGIDIETTEGASATAVYPGTVSMVIVMDGYHNVVLVRHGEYLTVYAGIVDLAVHKGQQVAAGQKLGKLYSDPLDNGRTRLHFEVRHEIEKLNPSEWLR